MKVCWKEKQKDRWIDLNEREKEKYYNKNGWSTICIIWQKKKGIQ